MNYMSRNKEGLLWCEWYVAATLGRSCCTQNAWSGCNSTCPRLHPEWAVAELVQAFQDGVDPTELANEWGKAHKMGHTYGFSHFK
jgi:hypothetical protein